MTSGLFNSLSVHASRLLLLRHDGQGLPNGVLAYVLAGTSLCLTYAVHGAISGLSLCLVFLTLIASRRVASGLALLTICGDLMIGVFDTLGLPEVFAAISALWIVIAGISFILKRGAQVHREGGL